jgi:leucyl-tRNA synthetase
MPQEAPVPVELHRALHATIKKVTEDLEALRFNTAISALMILLNALEEAKPLPRVAAEPFVILLAPFAPHLAEELWARLGHRESIVSSRWPVVDPAALHTAEVLLVVQVNGKVRARITVSAAASEEDVKAAALADEQVRKHLDGQTVKQVIVVPKRLVNIVV